MLVINRFSNLLKELNKIVVTSKHLVPEITKDARNFIDSEVENILKNIDIKEINRGDFSVRVSALRNAGYTNFFKVYKSADFRKLSKVNGISETTAYEIIKFVRTDAQQIRDNFVVKIDPANKTKIMLDLVKSLYVYIHSQNYIEEAKRLLDLNQETINQNIDQANLMLNKINWFFSSKETKKSSINAYLSLLEIENSSYLQECQFVIDSFNFIQEVKTKVLWQDYSENSANYYSTLEKLTSINKNNINENNGMSDSFVESVNELEPNLTGLKCTLRSYQEFGMKYVLHQGYVLLGDEMGLGKTVQAIASMVAIRNFGENRFLVVCPASVLINWCREISKHSDLLVFKLHGNNRDNELNEWIKFGGVAVTTYETLDKLDLTQVWNISLLVADEAHYVKNPKAQRTKNLLNACDRSERVLFMTGTPLENDVEEMSFLISILNREVSEEIKDKLHLTAAPLFREKVAPVYLRRTREDVLQELPELIESQEWCEMGENEKNSYFNSTISENFMAMRQVSWDIEDLQFSSKANRLKEICDEAKREKRKILIFSFFLNTIEKINKMFNNTCFGPINGSVLPQNRQKIIDEFTRAEPGSILLAQIQAGGTGVNIQSASCVILCEPQLKPSTENQAISRTYRMGQTRNVQVFKLLCQDSVDERIVEILDAKEDIFDNFADVSVVGLKSIEIDAKMSKNIVKEEKERLIKERIDK